MDENNGKNKPATVRQETMLAGNAGKDKEFTIKAPLISLVPIPEFQMDETSVDFSLEIKNSNVENDNVKKEAVFAGNISPWLGANVAITGKITSGGKHRRES
ncbi:MAG: DUF2589 domain-containing protein [Erysipelotrichaceae bacterium]|nr:DUF2589 domain-containing protein [Erysipelotrichaceae bacterium]